jgi:N6-adenosine-specific RNA methylase IME4
MTSEAGSEYEAQAHLRTSQRRPNSNLPSNDPGDHVGAQSRPGPFLELFARGSRKGRMTWGDQAEGCEVSQLKTLQSHDLPRRVPAGAKAT